MRDQNGSFDDFIEEVQVVMPAIKQLEARGLSAEHIAKLLEFLAAWLRSRALPADLTD